MQYIQFSSRIYKGQRIVKFIGDKAPVDPVRSYEIITPLLLGSKEYEEQKDLIKSRMELVIKQKELNSRFKRKYNKKQKKFLGSKKEENEINLEYAGLSEEINRITDLINSKAIDLEKKRIELAIENAIYVPPRNAVLVSNEEIKEIANKFLKLQQNELLLEDGTVITNNQLELERIANLTIDERKFEKGQQYALRVAQAAQMKTELEVQGDLKALEKSQEWLKKEKEIIEQRYSE